MKNNNNFYAEAFKNTLDHLHLHYDERRVDDDVAVYAIGMACESISHLMYMYTVKANGQCSIHTVLAHDIAKEKRTRVLEQMNKLHQKQRYVKFMLDRDDDLVAKLDFMFPPFVDEETDEKEIAKHLFGMLIMIHETLDEEIPELLSVLWWDDDAADKPKVKTDTSFLEGLLEGLKKARESAERAERAKALFGEEDDEEDDEEEIAD